MLKLTDVTQFAGKCFVLLRYLVYPVSSELQDTESLCKVSNLTKGGP